MRVCSFFEYEGKLKNAGIGNGIKLHRQTLESANIEVVNDVDGKYDILHLHSFTPKSLLTARKLKRKGVPVAITAHSITEDWVNSFWFSNLTLPFVRILSNIMYKMVDGIVCHSQFAKYILRSQGVRTKMEIINPSFDFERFSKTVYGGKQIREKYGLDGTVVFSVGYLFPKRKGVDTFVAVAKEFPDMKFVWFGKILKGIYRPQGLKIVKKAPENVIFTGYIERIGAGFDAGDIFFFPSTSETFGLSLLEAFAAKKPCLVNDIPGVAWAKNGFECLKGRTPEEHKANLIRLLEDKKLRKRLGENAYKRSGDHQYKTIGKEYKKFYQQLLENSR